MKKAIGSSSTSILAQVQSISFDMMENERVVDSIIPNTSISFDMVDISDAGKQITKIGIKIEPIKIFLAFRHLKFFALTSSKILSSLSYFQSSMAKNNKEEKTPEVVLKLTVLFPL